MPQRNKGANKSTMYCISHINLGELNKYKNKYKNTIAILYPSQSECLPITTYVSLFRMQIKT